mmetsp:Transcript_7506/g.24001  ORF Transcript_7506/g.24001 Transcript_7506/m.24001 type:complete len:212 (-) Transcript_7506:357-992(-)
MAGKCRDLAKRCRVERPHGAVVPDRVEAIAHRPDDTADGCANVPAKGASLLTNEQRSFCHLPLPLGATLGLILTQRDKVHDTSRGTNGRHAVGSGRNRHGRVVKGGDDGSRRGSRGRALATLCDAKLDQGTRVGGSEAKGGRCNNVGHLAIAGGVGVADDAVEAHATNEPLVVANDQVARRRIDCHRRKAISHRIIFTERRRIRSNFNLDW